MSKVITYSNWSYIDQLDGVALEDGERLALTWPDGETTEDVINVQKGHVNVSEQGSPRGYDCPVSKAFVLRRVNGVDVQVRIVGIEARRIPKLPFQGGQSWKLRN